LPGWLRPALADLVPQPAHPGKERLGFTKAPARTLPSDGRTNRCGSCRRRVWNRAPRGTGVAGERLNANRRPERFWCKKVNLGFFACPAKRFNPAPRCQSGLGFRFGVQPIAKLFRPTPSLSAVKRPAPDTKYRQGGRRARPRLPGRDVAREGIRSPRWPCRKASRWPPYRRFSTLGASVSLPFI
jgi:hypothetical protein